MLSLREKMAASPVMDMIFQELMTEDWAVCRQGTEDNGKRKVILTDDVFAVKWSKMQTKYVGSNSWGFAQYEDEEVFFGRVAYSYTKSGYAPLAAYESDGITIPQQQVIKLWASEIQNRMKQLFPGCSFEGTGRLSQ